MSETWILEKEFRFEAAHKLVHHDGKCARLHGHSFVGRVVVVGGTLHEDGPKRGMLVDYAELSAAIKPLVDDVLDHYYLNETLEMDSPTSEMIAKWLHGKLSQRLGITLNVGMSVVIEETCTSKCTYTR